MTKFEFNDVANYQPDTLAYFKGLKAKGSGAIIVKITQGTGYINPKATNQVNHADQAGLKTAGYHYAMFGGNFTTNERPILTHVLNLTIGFFSKFLVRVP